MKDLMQHTEGKPLLDLEGSGTNQTSETIPPNPSALKTSSSFPTNILGSGDANSTNYHQNEADKMRQDDFFNSYIGSNSVPSNINGAGSSCSDSVSRYEEEQKQPIAPHQPNVSYFPIMNQNPQIPPWYSQIQSDSSSLVTLVSEKKMSDSRRTFCLFVTFDLILTSLLWLIECGASASSKTPFFTVVRLQVTELSIGNSLFDIVCLAAARFAFLEIMYAAVRVRHWWPVALCTSVTDILLILKIFPIFKNSATQDNLIDVPMTIVILLTNFVISWIEVWLIDFKVLPSEEKLANKTVRQFIQSQHSVSFGQNDFNEKSPLLHGGRVYTPAQSFYTGATSDRLSYHSMPASESDFGSCISEGRVSRHRPRSAEQAPITKEEAVFVEKGRSAINQLWSLFKNDFVWKVEREMDNGDMLYSTDVPGYGKTFRIDTVVRGVSPQRIFQEIVLKAEAMPEWNKAVDDVKILKRIGEQTAISLEVSKAAANGLIKSRDFVTVRRVDKIDNAYISGGISADYTIPDSGRIRGANGPTGFIIEPCNDGFGSSKFVWILNTNLKGSLPQYLVNSNLCTTMINFVEGMKGYLGVES